MGATAEYIRHLTDLKSGDMGKARSFANKGLDEEIDGFELFTGLWWPLREKNHRAPKREIAWLILKLYGFCPLQNSDSHYDTLACQLRRCQPHEEKARPRFIDRFDRMLSQHIANIEPHMHWALRQLQERKMKLNWARLTDDLSIWDKGQYHNRKQDVREIWANEYLDIYNKPTEREL